MKTYREGLAELRQYGRWEALKMRCFSAWIGIEAHCLPKCSKARAQALIDEMRKP